MVWVVHIFCAIPLLLLSFFKSKYKDSLKARFFLYKNIRQYSADVHFHACSLGEVKSIKELVLNFDSRMTVITQTGFDAAKIFCKKVNFLAFESFIPFWLKPCKVLVLFEAEYWLMLVFIAKLKGAKIFLINARISDKSYQSYLRFAFFYRKIFSYIDEIFTQSAEDAKRLKNLGANKVEIFGNIKAHLKVKNSKTFPKFKEKLIIFASTHKGEEELLLRHFKLQKDEKLIIAPRHPERFVEIEKLLLKLELNFDKFSEVEADLSGKFKNPILLLDSLGELVNFYVISDVVVLGGSFIEGIGGHNPIEPASFNNSIITGVHIHNQKSLFESVEGVCFCENLEQFDALIHNIKTKAKLKNNQTLEPIIKRIRSKLDTRKGL